MVLGSSPQSTVTYLDLISKSVKPAGKPEYPEMNSKPSKSARKREHLALQSLGEQLIGLTHQQLEGIGLEERLFEAVSAAKSMRAHGALRRQKQLIGKLMRNVDPEPIRAAIDALGGDDKLAKKIFRESEEWRDRITGDDPDALAALFDYLGHQNQALVNEVKSYRSATADKFRKQAKRRIFREIHKEITTRVQNPVHNI
jgi:ribosome-associated protein